MEHKKEKQKKCFLFLSVSGLKHDMTTFLIFMAMFLREPSAMSFQAAPPITTTGRPLKVPRYHGWQTDQVATHAAAVCCTANILMWEFPSPTS